MQGDACPYSHDNTVEPCKQLVLHGVCRFGPNCHFSHEPLPAYAVAPLQEWFKEQDQLKQDRSARATDEAMHMDHEASQSPGDVAPTASQQDATNSGDDTSAAADDCGAPLKYSSWTDPWRLLYGTRLHNLGKRSAEPKAQSVTDNAAEFEPLSGPYSSWQDGWNRLFARDSVKQSQTALPVL